MSDKIGIIKAAELAYQAAAANNDPDVAVRKDDIGIITRCVDICRTYHTEKVVIAHIRKELQHYFEASPDMNLFGMALLHHVATPDDIDLFECTKWVYWQLLVRK